MNGIKNPVEYLGITLSKDNLIDFREDFEVKEPKNEVSGVFKKRI